MQRNTSPRRRLLVRALLAETAGRCWLCWGPLEPAEVTLDHILPKSWGGTRRRDNVAAAHEKCNNRRRSRLAACDLRSRRTLLRDERTGAWEPAGEPEPPPAPYRRPRKRERIMNNEKMIPVLKLVRDRMPELVRQKGERATFRKAGGAEFDDLLKRKLAEELGELLSARTPQAAAEEAGDLLEAIYAFAALRGAGRRRVDEVRRAKAAVRGTFDGRTVLVEVGSHAQPATGLPGDRRFRR